MDLECSKEASAEVSGVTTMLPEGVYLELPSLTLAPEPQRWVSGSVSTGKRMPRCVYLGASPSPTSTAPTSEEGLTLAQCHVRAQECLGSCVAHPDCSWGCEASWRVEVGGGWGQAGRRCLPDLWL